MIRLNNELSFYKRQYQKRVTELSELLQNELTGIDEDETYEPTQAVLDRAYALIKAGSELRSLSRAIYYAIDKLSDDIGWGKDAND